jgi:hypothetical protein
MLNHLKIVRNENGGLLIPDHTSNVGKTDGL